LRRISKEATDAPLHVKVGAATHVVDVEDRGPGRFTVRLAGGKVFDASLEAADGVTAEKAAESVTAPDSPDVIRGRGRDQVTRREGPSEQRNVGGGSPLTDARPVKVAGLAAPMPGVVLACHVVPGQHVIKGQTVLVLEAMKMKNDIKAPAEAVVTRVLVAAGDQVQHGTPLIEFEV